MIKVRTIAVEAGTAPGVPLKRERILDCKFWPRARRLIFGRHLGSRQAQDL